MPMQTIQRYALGQLVRVTAHFTAIEDDGSYVDRDPTTVAVSWRKPDGVVTLKTYGTDDVVKRDNAGIYHIDIQTPLSGTYWFRWVGTGAAEAAEEDSFYVKPSYVAEIPAPEP